MSYTSKEVEELTGASYRQLDHWVRRNWVRPIYNGRGKGHDREWPRDELFVARFMVRLTQVGIAASQAAKVARALVPKQQELTEGRFVNVRVGDGVWIRVTQ